MNLYEAVISTDATQVKVGSQSLNLSDALFKARPGLRGYKDRKVVIGIRPEHLTDAALAPVTAPGTTLGADVELIEALGNELQVHFIIDATRVRSEEAQAAAETRELEGLQTLQTGAAGLPASPGSLPAASSRPARAPPSAWTPSGSTSSTTRTGRPSGPDSHRAPGRSMEPVRSVGKAQLEERYIVGTETA